jgi:hypothetical protein
MRLFLPVLFATTLALGCSSGNGNNNSGSGGNAGTGGAAAGGSGGSGGSAAGGSAAGGSAGSGAGGAPGDAGKADTYASFAKGFFDKYCVGCHDSSDPNRDYSSMTDITRDHAEIACGVATTKLAGCASFPPPEKFPIGTGPKPTNAERDQLVAWIAAGLPQ